MFKQKKAVNVGVSVNQDGEMEAVIIDEETRKVLDYRTVQIDYNYQTKEIADYNVFASSLRQILFDEMKLNPKNINLVLTIPSIHFTTAEIPEGVSPADDTTIKTILSSNAQDLYLFKRHEPVNAYQLYTNNPKGPNTVIYSSIQSSAAESISDVLINEVGVENFSINNPYASVINALSYCGCIEKQVNSNDVWNFVQITNNGFVLFSMYGTKIREINDMPLPLKTFSPEEIYESMALSLQNNLSIYPASSLYVLSRTNLLSAQVLLQNMELRGDVDFLENNKFLTAPFIDIADDVDADLALKKMSVEVVGSAITDKNSPLKLCYLSNKDDEDEIYGFVPWFGKELPLNNSLISGALGALIGIIFAFFMVFFFIGKGVNGYLTKEKNHYQAEKTRLETEITKAKGETEGNVETVIADISKNNVATMEYFNVISTEISPSMWLTYFYSDSTGALAIKGNTNEVGSLYAFFKGIKGSVQNSSITLTKLEYNDIDSLLAHDYQGNKTMNFEITNSSYDAVAKASAESEVSEEGSGDKKSSSDKKKSKKKDSSTDSGKKSDNSSKKSGDDFSGDLPPIDPITN